MAVSIREIIPGAFFRSIDGCARFRIVDVNASVVSYVVAGEFSILPEEDDLVTFAEDVIEDRKPRSFQFQADSSFKAVL